MINCYKELKTHVGHHVVVAKYGSNPRKPDNVAIECEDCGTVLLDYDHPDIEGGHSSDYREDIVNAECGNCGRPATHEAGGIHRCDRCNDM